MISREYLISLGFLAVKEAGREYLRKEYYGVSLFDWKDEFFGTADVSVYLQKKDEAWIITKCQSLDQYHEDEFNLHFKGNKLNELLAFDLKNQQKSKWANRRAPLFNNRPSRRVTHSF